MSTPDYLTTALVLLGLGAFIGLLRSMGSAQKNIRGIREDLGCISDELNKPGWGRTKRNP